MAYFWREFGLTGFYLPSLTYVRYVYRCMYRDTTAYISVHTYMYVPHLEFLANKGAEIEMSARSRFLGSRLGVLDRDAPLKIGERAREKINLVHSRLNLIKKLRLPMRFINRGNERLMSLLLPIRIKSEKEGENNNNNNHHFPHPSLHN